MSKCLLGLELPSYPCLDLLGNLKHTNLQKLTVGTEWVYYKTVIMIIRWWEIALYDIIINVEPTTSFLGAFEENVRLRMAIAHVGPMRQILINDMYRITYF